VAHQLVVVVRLGSAGQAALELLPRHRRVLPAHPFSIRTNVRLVKPDFLSHGTTCAYCSSVSPVFATRDLPSRLVSGSGVRDAAQIITAYGGKNVDQSPPARLSPDRHVACRVRSSQADGQRGG